MTPSLTAREAGPTEYTRMKNRAHLSPEQTRQRVVERHRAGAMAYDIANRLGLRVDEVRTILALEGIQSEESVDYGPVHPMWSMDEDRRRQAIARRAAEGARRAREEISGLSP